MTTASEYLLKNKSQTEDFNQIRSEVKKLIEDNSSYKLKNIFHDGFSAEEELTFCTAWFVELMDYNVSLELIQLLHNYFGGKCIISKAVGNDGITIIFSYKDIPYVIGYI